MVLGTLVKLHGVHKCKRSHCTIVQQVDLQRIAGSSVGAIHPVKLHVTPRAKVTKLDPALPTQRAKSMQQKLKHGTL